MSCKQTSFFFSHFELLPLKAALFFASATVGGAGIVYSGSLDIQLERESGESLYITRGSATEFGGVVMSDAAPAAFDFRIYFPSASTPGLLQITNFLSVVRGVPPTTQPPYGTVAYQYAFGEELKPGGSLIGYLNPLEGWGNASEFIGLSAYNAITGSSDDWEGWLEVAVEQNRVTLKGAAFAYYGQQITAGQIPEPDTAAAWAGLGVCMCAMAFRHRRWRRESARANPTSVD